MVGWMTQLLNNNGLQGQYLSVALLGFTNVGGKVQAQFAIYWNQNVNVNAQASAIGGYIVNGIQNGVQGWSYQLVPGASYYIPGDLL